MVPTLTKAGLLSELSLVLLEIVTPAPTSKVVPKEINRCDVSEQVSVPPSHVPPREPGQTVAPLVVVIEITVEAWAPSGR